MAFSGDPFDPQMLRQLAGEKVFARGEELVKTGSVNQLRAGPDRATARVQDAARACRAKLWRSRGELQFHCDCAAGRDHVFCQHCVALGLAWLGLAESAPDPGEPPAASGAAPTPKSAASSASSHPRSGPPEPAVAPAELRAYVNKLDKKRLLDLALEAIDYDEILRRRLMLETLGILDGRRLGEAELKVYRRLLREAIEVSDYVDYDSMPDYVQGIEEALRPLDALLEKGQAEAVIELAELALVELENAADAVDASDGSLNHLYDELQRLHHGACRAAKPDPARLAARLLEYELDGGMGIFNNAVATYSDVLGPAGLGAYRQLLQRAWEQLEPRRAAASPRPKATEVPEIDHRRFQIVALMERFAANTGESVDTRVAIRAKDLSSPQDYLAIAELLREADRLEEACEWGEKGLARFPGSLETSGLREFLIPLHARLGQTDKAVGLVWTEFRARPGAEEFRKLRAHAADSSWPEWRERALRLVREDGSRRDGSALVEILLAEEETAAALKEARARGCRVDLWLELATRCEAGAPAEALEIYRQQLDAVIARGDSRSYQQAAGLMRKIRHLFHALNRGGEFNVYRDSVRVAHRHRRGLVKLLDALGRG